MFRLASDPVLLATTDSFLTPCVALTDIFALVATTTVGAATCVPAVLLGRWHHSIARCSHESKEHYNQSDHRRHQPLLPLLNDTIPPSAQNACRIERTRESGTTARFGPMPQSSRLEQRHKAQKRACQDNSAQNDSARESAKRLSSRSGPAEPTEPSVSPVKRAARRLSVLSCVPIRSATNCQLECGRFTETAYSRTSQSIRSLTRWIPCELTPRRQWRRIVDGWKFRRRAKCWTVRGGGTTVRAHVSKRLVGAGIASFVIHASARVRTPAVTPTELFSTAGRRARIWCRKRTASTGMDARH